jgi:hypothetical protein
MGDGLSDVMEHYLATESPSLLIGFHVAWIFLSNIVLVRCHPPPCPPSSAHMPPSHRHHPTTNPLSPATLALPARRTRYPPTRAPLGRMNIARPSSQCSGTLAPGAVPQPTPSVFHPRWPACGSDSACCDDSDPRRDETTRLCVVPGSPGVWHCLLVLGR